VLAGRLALAEQAADQKSKVDHEDTKNTKSTCADSKRILVILARVAR
jgi:hypothetical protein